MLNNITIFILNIILLIIIININNKLDKKENNNLNKKENNNLNKKENFGVIMSATLGDKIGDVFNTYFKLNLVPLRQLGSNIDSLLKGRINGILKVNGTINIKKDNIINGKCKIVENANIDSTLTIESNSNFKDSFIINKNDLMVNNNSYFNNKITSKQNFNYIY